MRSWYVLWTAVQSPVGADGWRSSLVTIENEQATSIEATALTDSRTKSSCQLMRTWPRCAGASCRHGCGSMRIDSVPTPTSPFGSRWALDSRDPCRQKSDHVRHLFAG